MASNKNIWESPSNGTEKKRKKKNSCSKIKRENHSSSDWVNSFPHLEMYNHFNHCVVRPGAQELPSDFYLMWRITINGLHCFLSVGREAAVTLIAMGTRPYIIIRARAEPLGPGYRHILDLNQCFRLPHGLFKVMFKIKKIKENVWDQVHCSYNY